MKRRKSSNALKAIMVLAAMAAIVIVLVVILGVRINHMKVTPTSEPVTAVEPTIPPVSRPAKPSQEPTPEVTVAPEVREDDPVELRVYYTCPFDEEMQDYIYELLDLFEIDVDLAFPLAMVYRESGFNRTAVSSHGAQGYIQLMPDTYKTMYKEVTTRYPQLVLKNDVFDPYTNLACGLYYLRHISERYGACDGVVNEVKLPELCTRYAMGPSGGYKFYSNNGHWNSQYAKNLFHAAEWFMTYGSLEGLDW